MHKIKQFGIPLEEVGNNLKLLNRAIEENGMTIAADAKCNIQYMQGKADTILSATITVYFMRDVD